MQIHSPRCGWVVRSCGIVLVGSLVLTLSSTTAWASPSGSSDGRATATQGHLRNCSTIGFRGDTRVGSQTNLSASDANVAGTVKPNGGLIDPGTGQEVDIAITGPPTVVVDAVVVGGRNDHSTYRGSQYLPPMLQPDQHYIPPPLFDTVPTIKYWFTCYHIEPGTALPEVPQVLSVPLAGGAIFAVWMVVQRRRRKTSTRHTAGSHTARS